MAEICLIWKLKKYTNEFRPNIIHNLHVLVQILVTANFPWKKYG